MPPVPPGPPTLAVAPTSDPPLDWGVKEGSPPVIPPLFDKEAMMNRSQRLVVLVVVLVVVGGGGSSLLFR